MVITVVSGKGGTGKTTVAAALSELAAGVIRVDCDVDAPNLYLFYQGIDVERKDFYGGKKAYLIAERCTGCGVCEAICRFGAINHGRVDPFSCEGCGACTYVCPEAAIALMDCKTADTFLTETEHGNISRARMGIGSDGSGKLVTYLRNNAKRYIMEGSLTIIDGSPGIGCPVIASITDTDIALIVTEPTRSGLEDLKRIVELAEGFHTQMMICINKYDINLEMTSAIQTYAGEKKLPIVGRIPFDAKVMEAVNSLTPITRYEDSPARKAVEAMWEQIKDRWIDNKKQDEWRS